MAKRQSRLFGAPCPCGYYGDAKRPCKCSPFQIERYLSRVSGPLIDRIDIHIEVPAVAWKQLRADGPAAEGLSSKQMREQVLRAREAQRKRFAQTTEPASASPGSSASPAASLSSPSSSSDAAASSNPQSACQGEESARSPEIRNPQSTEPTGLQRGFFESPTSPSSPAAAGPSSAGPAVPLSQGAQPAPFFSAGAGSPFPGSHANGTTTNANMSSRQVRRFCKLDAPGETILKQAMTELGLSARAHDKVLRVARTIADMEGDEDIKSYHVAEAVQYRRLDRKL